MTKQLLSGNYLSSFKICINSISIYWNLCPSFTRRDEMFSVSVFWSVFAQAYFSRDFLAVVSIHEKVTKKIFPEKQMIKKVSLPLHADLFLLVDISEVYQTLFFWQFWTTFTKFNPYKLFTVRSFLSTVTWRQWIKKCIHVKRWSLCETVFTFNRVNI